MSSTVGRIVVLVLTNQSGGGVANGDLVYIDTGHDNAFITGTTSAYTGMVGVCIEPNGIASSAAGRIQIEGLATLINVNASVTRGHYAKSYTVAKQATDAGASRVVGAFGQFTTGGTTPSIALFGFPDAASSSAAAGTPGLTLSTTNSAGAASTFVATDATVAVFDATAPVTQAFGDSAAAGSAGTAARRDHKHGMPANPAEFSTATAAVATDESTSSTSYANLATSGPAVTVTIGSSGKAKVTVTAYAYATNSANGQYMSFAVSGATTTAAGDSTSMAIGGGTLAGGVANGRFSVTSIVTGLGAGSTTFTAKYRVDNASDIGHFNTRAIIVEPVL